MTGPLERYYVSEYHRRNMQVARVCGAQASVEQALERALTVKSIPVWLIAYLESAAARLPGLQHDLAAWRDLAPDAPEHVQSERADPVTNADCCQAVEQERDALRAKLTEARAELHGPIKPLSAQDYSNVIAHLSPELEPNGELPNRNSLMMALVEASNAARKEAARAERAEAERAAQIEVDARIADREAHHAMREGMCYAADGMSTAYHAIRTQPHDRTALDRIIAATRAEALREAAKKATSFLVGDPQNGIPLRNPMAHEVADTILARADQIEKGETK